jgi:lipopolysaccharide export system permease protein
MIARDLDAPRLPWRVWLYLCRDFLVYFGVCFLFFFVIFFINQILYMAEQILSKHAPIVEVLKLLVFAMPNYISLSFPFATLVAMLMSLGQFTAQNEILILQATGISTRSLFVPFFVLGIGLAGFSFFSNDVLLPAGTINFNKVYRKLIYSTPTLELDSDTVKKYQDVTLINGKVKDDRINDIEIIDHDEAGNERLIFARSALLVSDESASAIVTLALSDAFILSTNSSDALKYDYSTADRMLYNILIQNFSESIAGLSPRGMSSFDLGKLIEEKDRATAKKNQTKGLEASRELAALRSEYLRFAASPAPLDPAYAELANRLAAYRNALAPDPIDRNLLYSKREYHKKFSLPLASLCFVIFAFPISLLTKRDGRVSGFIIGILVSFVYWMLMYFADLYGFNVRNLPSAIVWIPDIVILTAGMGFLFARKLR